MIGMKLKEVYEYSVNELTKAGIEEAKSDAFLLFEDVFQVSKGELFLKGDEPADENLFATLKDNLKTRCKHVPVQYITGKQDFMGLVFHVNENVLIPRFDTEILVEEALKEMHDGFRVLDMCTGSGCILLSLMKYSNDCEGIGVDISNAALEVATKNRDNFELQATFIQSDLFEKVEGKFDMIVSNPPYIKSDVIPTLMEEVKDYEPLLALDGKEDGCFFYEKIAAESPNYLYPGGMIFFEIGYDQAEAVSNLLKKTGFADIKVIKDYAGLDRVVIGTFIGGN